MSEKIVAFGPASVGNTGPCYDVVGYALRDVGDFVEVEKVERAEDFIIWNQTVLGPAAAQLRGVDHKENSAWIAADRILETCWGERLRDFSIRMTLHKYLPVGSGIGSSSSSAVAAVKAVVEILHLNTDPNAIIEALEVAEEATAESGYPDNVVPSYFGGLFLINENHSHDGFPGGEKRYLRIHGGDSMISVIVRPDVAITTKMSRDAVRDYVYKHFVDPDHIDPDPEQAAIHVLDLVRRQSAKTAETVSAFAGNDVARMGAIMRDNPILEGARAHLIPRFHDVKRAAMEAGAYGCTISGAGPALIAVTDSDEAALQIRDAMRGAFRPRPTQWLISRVNQDGAQVIDSIDEFIQKARTSNNFYDNEGG